MSYKMLSSSQCGRGGRDGTFTSGVIVFSLKPKHVIQVSQVCATRSLRSVPVVPSNTANQHHAGNLHVINGYIQPKL